MAETNPKKSVDGAWAESLVGRHWEIFWDESSDSAEKADNKSQTEAAAATDTKDDNPTSQSAEKDGPSKEEEDDSESDEDADVTDWYDATVVAIKDGMCQIRFVGDDETTYSMHLTPKIVRPSAMAWMKRSRALLRSKQVDIHAWELDLPIDTSTLQDRRVMQDWTGSTALVSSDESQRSENEKQLKEREKIQRLHFLVRSQIHLRSKLAPIVDCGEKKSSDGEPVPTEAYLDHLVKCLENLQQLCVWYETCWLLYEKVVRGATVALPSAAFAAADAAAAESRSPTSAAASTDSSPPVRSSSADTPHVSVDFIKTNCLEAGRAMIINLHTKDTSPSGSKRRPMPFPSPSRSTKRRKTYNASSYLECRDEQRGDDDYLLVEEGVFMTLSSIKRFVKKMKEKDSRWYVDVFLCMLQRMSSDIQEPILTWKGKAEAALGEKKADKDEDNDSPEDEGKTKVGDDSKDVGSEEDCDSDESSSDEREHYFTYEDVSECLAERSKNEILSRIDLSLWAGKLQMKLDGIEAFELNGWRTVSHMVDDVGQDTRMSDGVLASLLKLKEDADTTNPHVKNINPLGRGSSRLDRSVIDNAIAVREWLVDLRHVELFRERLTFVQDVVSRAPTLPHVPSPPQGLEGVSTSSMLANLGQAMSRVQSVSLQLYAHVHTFTGYENMVAESASRGAAKLHTIEEVSAALAHLRSTPVIHLVEEKLYIRYDVLTWRAKARQALNVEPGTLEYDVVESLKKELDAIVRGTSPARLNEVQRLERDVSADTAIRTFATTEIDQLCKQEVATIERLYLKAADWKERADAIIMALRMHGNPTAGDSIGSHRSAAMVDLKRIEDLLEEYGGLGVVTEQRRKILKSVRDEAVEWCLKIERVVSDDQNLLERLTVARDGRPKGVLMDPARHTVDSWIELLDWHYRIVLAFKDLIAWSKSDAAGPDSAAVEENFSKQIDELLYPLMVEGLEVIAMFSRKFAGDYEVVPGDTLSQLAKFKPQRAVRAVSITKLQSTSLGESILSRIIESTRDMECGSPLFCLLFVVWRVSVIDLIHRQSTTEEGPARPTLVDAKSLDSCRPRLHVLDEIGNTGTPSFHSLFSSIETVEVMKFHQLIADGEQVEMSARRALTEAKDVVRGSFEKAQEVQDCLATIRQLLSEFKSRMQGSSAGLILSTALEHSLDRVMKDLTWLVRTFSYAVLHSDKIPEVKEGPAADGETTEDARRRNDVPWEVLVSLHERLPDPGGEGPGGDIVRISYRVKELYDTANTWQNEVTSQLSISFRGAKRRAPGASPDDTEKIDTAKLAQLAKHPILRAVSMPREAAVRQVLSKARDFEEKMVKLLDLDFEGSNVDKAPHPQSSSLVGKNGEFLLFRLTGSTLFACLKDTLSTMSNAAEDVLADTPGKAAFDWIAKAVDWICDLKEAVTETSPFESSGVGRLVIPISEANRLLQRGNRHFLDISDELRRTLADHKIFLSTNKQTERLTVVIGKGGAHHSLGGTIVKWCPLLYECLREDIVRLGRWESRVVETAKGFKSINEESGATTSNDQETIIRWYRFRERVSCLLVEGRDSLVITPNKSIVSSLKSLQSSLEALVNKTLSEAKGSTGITATTIMKGRYEDGEAAVDDRSSLLDSLLNRLQLEKRVDTERKAGAVEVQNVPMDGLSFRDKARSSLDKAMRKGVRIMGIDVSQSSEISVFCATIAWKMEEALFTACKRDSTTVTDRYWDKLRSMRYNLEDTKNPTLCPRVLVGEIGVDRLVTMSSAEMASQKVRQTRAKAQEEGKRNVTLNPGTMKKAAPKQKTVASLLAKTALQKPAQPEQPINEGISPRSVRPVASLPQTPHAAMHPLGHTPESTGDATLSPPLISPATPSKSALKIASTMATQIPPPPLTGPAPPLPTPPSLAVAAAPEESTTSSPERNSVQNSSGGDMFFISVSGHSLKVSFHASDSESNAQVDGKMPEKLHEKGRLQIDEFSKFLGAKLSTGRWTAVPMRMSTAACSKEYKRFYKEYETKKRIAMFRVDNESKLFLVTPKFHGAAKSLRESFDSRTSTYAVYLTRARQFSD